ncbi:sulfatase-like hydrolase/transferase [Opitutaceae bacterium]|nr:sulfatase-like hydrolase/transferase [Opitutaceae bacterium]
MRTLEITFLALLSCLALLAQEGLSKQPNVVLIITDDQGYSDMGFNGNPHVRTPVLDQFAEGATVFYDDNGVFDLDVKTAGTYRNTCRWSEILNATHPVTMKIGDEVFTNEILYAESECRFDEVELEAGPCSFEAFVEIDGKPNGFRFVEIEKLLGERENF